MHPFFPRLGVFSPNIRIHYLSIVDRIRTVLLLSARENVSYPIVTFLTYMGHVVVIRNGIVNLTADMLFPEISLDTRVPKYKGLARKQSSIFPIYQVFYH